MLIDRHVRASVVRAPCALCYATGAVSVCSCATVGSRHRAFLSLSFAPAHREALTILCSRLQLSHPPAAMLVSVLVCNCTQHLGEWWGCSQEEVRLIKPTVAAMFAMLFYRRKVCYLLAAQAVESRGWNAGNFGPTSGRLYNCVHGSKIICLTYCVCIIWLEITGADAVL